MDSATHERPVASWITLVPFAMALMLSPDSLTLLGNGVGIAGVSFLGVLLIAAIIHLFTTLSYGEIFSVFPGSGGEARYTEAALGKVPAIFLPLCSRVVFTVCAATGMLATAGYVFNEIFVYWFPNLGFSFCLLGLLLLIGVLGKRVTFAAQGIFMAMALLGLSFLSVWGLIAGGNESLPPSSVENPSFNLLHMGAMGLVLFIGFDLAGLASGGRDQQPFNVAKPMAAAVIFSGIVLSLWGLVSYIYVPPQRLADTSVPYSLAARAVLGWTGRKIMGLVVLAATCGAVNALLAGVARMIIAIAFRGPLPSFFGVSDKRASVPIIFLSLSIAVMLASGMAGEPDLEVYTRGSIYLWLLNYGAVHLSVLILRRRGGLGPQSSAVLGYPVIPFIGLLATCAGVFGLLWFDAEPGLLLKFMAVVLATGLVFGMVWVSIRSRKSPIIT